MVFLYKIFFEKVDLKKSIREKKIMKSCPGCKELTIYFIINTLTPLKYNIYENIMVKIEHLLFWSKCSIFHNVLKSIRNIGFFSMSSKNRKIMS